MTDTTLLIIAGAFVALALLVVIGWWYGCEVDDLGEWDGDYR